MTTQVEFISAPWCARCKVLRPVVEETCRIAGATFSYVNFDELDDDGELKLAIKSLPSMRTRLASQQEWIIWPASEIDSWRFAVLGAAVFNDPEF